MLNINANINKGDKMKIKKTTLFGYKQLVKMLETKKVNKDNTISFGIKDVRDLPIICTDLLLQLDEKKIYKIFNQKKQGRA
jgi:hypothetical protein